MSSMITVYITGISGYVAANMYRKMGGDSWVWNINLTSFLFAGPFFLVWAVVNSVAWGYGATQALPWTTVVLLMALWLFSEYHLSLSLIYLSVTLFLSLSISRSKGQIDMRSHGRVVKGPA